jgi:hypothetical protein
MCPLCVQFAAKSLSFAAPKPVEELAVSFATRVQIFVLLELLLEFDFDNVDGGEHV